MFANINFKAHTMDRHHQPFQELGLETMESPSASQGSFLLTLDDISRLISRKGQPAETLENIVRLIQQRFQTDVCSVYLIEPDRTTLVLAATIGLRPESVR